MSRYRKILSKIWDDDKFPYLSLDGRLLFMYHLTSPRSTPFLLYIEGYGAIADALRMASPRLKKATQEIRSKGMAWYSDDGSNLLFLPKALRYKENAPESPNAVKTWLSLFHDLPNTPFLNRCLSHWVCLSQAIDNDLTLAFFKELPTPNPIQEQEQEQYSPLPPRGAKKVLTLEEEISIRERFQSFWAGYPKKKQKALAEETWMKIFKDGQDNALFDRIMFKLAEAVKSRDWTKDEGQYIPWPKKWLKLKGWEDEYESGKGRNDWQTG